MTNPLPRPRHVGPTLARVWRLESEIVRLIARVCPGSSLERHPFVRSSGLFEGLMVDETVGVFDPAGRLLYGGDVFIRGNADLARAYLYVKRVLRGQLLPGTPVPVTRRRST